MSEPALDLLSSDVYLHLYRFLPPQALFSLIQTSAALRSAFQLFAWEHCELASPRMRPEKHECFGFDGSRLQIPFDVLFYPELYSWFPNLSVRSVHIDLRGLRNMFKTGQRLPRGSYPRLTSISYYETYDRVPVLRNCPSSKQQSPNIAYPSHFSLNKHDLIVGSFFDASILKFLSVNFYLYDFWHLNPHALTNLTSIEVCLHPGFPKLIRALPTLPNLKRLCIVCYVAWVDRIPNNYFPQILPAIKDIQLTSTLKTCELKFSRVLNPRDFDFFDFSPLEQIDIPSKLTVPAVTSLSCNGTMPLISIGHCFSFPNLQHYSDQPQFTPMNQLLPFPPMFLAPNCLETVTLLVLGIESQKPFKTQLYLKNLAKFKNLKKLGLDIYSPWNHTGCFLYLAIDAVSNFQGPPEELQQHVEQRIEEMTEEIQGFRYVDYWQKTAKFIHQDLPAFVAFIKDQKTKIFGAAMDILKKPTKETELETSNQILQNSSAELISVDDFIRQVTHFRTMEIFYEQLMTITTLDYLQFSIGKTSLYFYCTPRFINLFKSHPSLKQALISRNQYVYETFLFCSLLSLEETKKNPYVHESFTDMTYKTMMHQFSSLPYSYYFLPAHQRSLDFQIVVDAQNKRQFTREEDLIKTFDQFCMPFSNQQFDDEDFNGWI